MLSLSTRETGYSAEIMTVVRMVLFDKLIEERETQTAGSWRVTAHAQHGRDFKETLATLRFLKPTPKMGVWSGNRLVTHPECRCPLRSILGLTSKPDQNETLQSESLILAQNERWRQA